MEEKEIVIKRKINPLIKAIVIVIIVICIIFSWIHFIEPKMLEIIDYNITSSKIPSSFNGFTIVQFSDIHFGRTTNEKELEKVVEKINDCEPDIVIFTGDLFDSYITLSDDNFNFLKETLKKIKSTFKKYAIFGDSDLPLSEKYLSVMTEAGFTMLNGLNEEIYYKGNKPIYISGIDTIKKEKPNYEKAFASRENFQIFVSHEPIVIDDVVGKTDVFLAGHTLGGLVNIPFIGGVIKKENTGVYNKGYYVRNDTKVYISNGIGTENLSIRLFNVPSINCYHLLNI